ncbi:MAG: hypothetical protein QF632_00050 [Candidatus Woesearchaeota archaeon]|nr:hypothetical protein [Candidatus Woesearchaeota archaeon]MDP7458084.1 hypothetical protein [Candidatus Woesearchaeota archaeon]
MGLLDIFKGKKKVKALPPLEGLPNLSDDIPNLKPSDPTSGSVPMPQPSAPPMPSAPHPPMHQPSAPPMPSVPLPPMPSPVTPSPPKLIPAPRSKIVKPGMHHAMPKPPLPPTPSPVAGPGPVIPEPTPVPEHVVEPPRIVKHPGHLEAPPSPEELGVIPSYVKVEDFKDMLGGIQIVKTNLKQCDEIFERLNQVKNDEDKEFEKWRSKLEDLQRKLIYVDKVLFEAKGEA